jgi:hypothetical protein
MTTDNFSEYVVPQEDAEYSITDIAPTLLRYLEKKCGLPKGRIDSGVLGSDVKFYSLYDVQKLGKHYCGGSLDFVVENRLDVDIESFERIIIVLVDGMNLNSMAGVGGDFIDKIKVEFTPMSTSFPSMPQ